MLRQWFGAVCLSASGAGGASGNWTLDLQWHANPGGGGGLVQPAGAGLAAVDHAGGRVLPWSTDTSTVEEALARHGRPEIFNTDQGSQFTRAAFTGSSSHYGDFADDRFGMSRVGRSSLLGGAV